MASVLCACGAKAPYPGACAACGAATLWHSQRPDVRATMRAAWTPERRAQQAERARNMPLEARRRGGTAPHPPFTVEQRRRIGEGVQRAWRAKRVTRTPEQRRNIAAGVHRASRDGGA